MIRENAVKNCKALCSALLGTLAVLSCIGPATSWAENPASAKVQFTIERTNITRRGLEDLTFHITHTFQSKLEVESSGTCKVELSACLSKFVPIGTSDDGKRNCSKVIIGTKLVGTGTRTVRFTLVSQPVVSPRHEGRQVSFQTQSICSDAQSVQAVIASRPRARKVSRPDYRGVSQTKFMQQLKNSFR